MSKRRDTLKLGLAAAGVGLASKVPQAKAATKWETFPQSGVVFPDNIVKWSIRSGHQVKALKCHSEVKNDNGKTIETKI